MPTKRREYLALLGGGAVIAASTALSGGCSPALRQVIAGRQGKRKSPPPAPLPQTGDFHPAVRLLNRAAFGPASGDAARVAAMGNAAWIHAQLNVPAGENEAAQFAPIGLRGIGPFHPSPYELRDLGEKEVTQELAQAALLQAVYSPWQLRERMVDFWSNHFNLYAHKGNSAFLLDADITSVVRAHALDTFPALLRASAHSPAMLGYLDNGQNKKGVANENYARELMELHSLGIGGGYTQKDVAEVARCLTGWTTEERFLHKKGTFRFDADRHDDNPKTVLGTRIRAGGGQSDGETVLNLLAHHPSTARFIARKLVRYFIGHEDAALISRVAAVYTQTGGDIKALLGPILHSLEILSAPPIMKRPFDYLVSALRAGRAQTDGGKPIQHHLAQMGQALWEWPMPDGYPDQTGAWTGSLLHRWNFAGAFTSGGIKNTNAQWEIVAPTAHDALQNLLGCRASDPGHAHLLSVLAGHAPAERAALIFASPAFQWR